MDLIMDLYIYYSFHIIEHIVGGGRKRAGKVFIGSLGYKIL